MTIKFNPKKKELRLSVRDITLLGVPMTSSIRIPHKNAEFGQIIHNKIQERKKRLDSEYESEYYLKYKVKISDWRVLIRGRLDLLLKKESEISIEEIKSVNLHNFEGENDVRLSSYKRQLQCYGWLYQQKNPQTPQIYLKLIIFNRFDNFEHHIPVPLVDMKEFLISKLEQIISEEEKRIALQTQKIYSLEHLKFPFEYRAYQKNIIESINETIDQELFSIIEAPSGLGKTVVSLYPMINKAILTRSKIFFLTAKTTQRHIVEKTLDLFSKQGVNFLAITLKAKEKMCTNSFYFCHPEYCSFLKNYQQNYPQEYLEYFIQKRGIITPEIVEQEALRTEAFCPFELALDISLESDVIIGDYNYVFHPRTALQRFFGDQGKPKAQFYLIIDEAHNLVNRSLSYYSHSLALTDIRDLRQSIKELKRKIKGVPLPEFLPIALERFFRTLQSEYSISVTTHIIADLNLKDFQQLLLNLEENVVEYLKFLLERRVFWPDDPILGFYYHFRDFVNTALLAQNKEEFSILYNSQEGEIKILCKDASSFLNYKLLFFKSALAISATITPFPFYRDLLGFPIEKTHYKSFPSPFPPKNRVIIVVPTIDTRYKYRPHYYREIALLLVKAISIKQGKYFAFFPSFSFANNVAELINPQNKFNLIIQTPNMHDEQREEFIETIKKSKNIIAIAVSAGIFAEGVDFPGMLDGVFVVSPSLPNVSFERELIRQYYEEKFSNGFAYAYQFPGLTRSFQAAGRLIRTASDRGIIMFIGKRFSNPNYANCFPRYYYTHSPQELVNRYPLEKIESFWKSQENK